MPSTLERLNDLSQDEHGIYDCTHCFNCIDACPKGVAPMSQIMRLRRRAGTDYKIVDHNNGHRHEEAFTGLVRDYGLLNEAELLPRSYGGNSWWGKFHPRAAKELLSSLSTVVTGRRARQGQPEDRDLRPQAGQARSRPAQADLRARSRVARSATS